MEIRSQSEKVRQKKKYPKGQFVKAANGCDRQKDGLADQRHREVQRMRLQ